MEEPTSIVVTLPQIAKAIDHSLLHPALTDSEIQAGLELAKKLRVAAACVKPYSVSIARDALADSGVRVCAVVGFPHGSSTTATKVYEAEEAVREGAHEIDMVVNVGKVLGGDWEYATNEIRAVSDAITGRRGGHGVLGIASGNASGSGVGAGMGTSDILSGSSSGAGDIDTPTATLKVIFETDFLEDAHIVRLCKICSAIPVAFVKTSTGFGFVKQRSGLYAARGATARHVRLMRASVGPNVQVKAAGGIRTLDELLLAMAAGATRVGASATEEIIEEAIARGIGAAAVRMTLPSPVSA